MAIREIFLITSGPSERNVSDRHTSKVSDPVLVTAPASLGARRGALVLVIALFVAFCVLTPFARVPMGMTLSADDCNESDSDTPATRHRSICCAATRMKRVNQDEEVSPDA